MYNRGRPLFPPPPRKRKSIISLLSFARRQPGTHTRLKALTLAALDKPPILRRNKDGMFMTTDEIERDDARMLAEERARPCSRPPVNKTEEVFPASGWPTGHRVQVRASRSWYAFHTR